MNIDDKLRHDVKILKILNGVSYKEIAEQIGINQSSIYNWLKCDYDFGEDRIAKLQSVIAKYQEV